MERIVPLLVFLVIFIVVPIIIAEILKHWMPYGEAIRMVLGVYIVGGIVLMIIRNIRNMLK
ncbi:MAG: hypothetical protein QM762_12775 [Chryseolinea sp.]